MSKSGWHFLYRHYDKDSNLLYVGISCDAIRRSGEHRWVSQWFHLVKTIDVESFKTKEQAVVAEWLAIEDERPRFNKTGQGLIFIVREIVRRKGPITASMVRRLVQRRGKHLPHIVAVRFVLSKLVKKGRIFRYRDRRQWFYTTKKRKNTLQVECRTCHGTGVL